MFKISIIIVTYNADMYLEEAIKSIIEQNSNNFELIIIDGKSTDNTLSIIKKYDKNINYFISEKDNGIYDAMNKGLNYAKGEYVYFLGADDTLYNKNVLRDIEKYLNNKVDILSGNVYLIDRNLNMRKLARNKYTKKEIISGQMIPHQGMFIKRELALKYKFNVKYRIASDYEMLLKAINDNATILFVNNIVANYSMSGVSSMQMNSSAKEYINIIKNNVSIEFANLYKKKIIKNSIKEVIKNIFVYLTNKKIYLYLKGWKSYN
ncbi:glycosyltransferase family 2 protein [Megamonas sp.]|uniref:glycosyltransferase family 2 protein n=1 Tax=Megamonas sp. TaxID=2049033 RepID=UPI00257B64BC|nr:glycosyltransferase family 2 protein [Megamonas sp.]MBS5780316.1 glycosyltransferase [Megamonas sp.]